jgi:hypothetical protein
VAGDQRRANGHEHGGAGMSTIQALIILPTLAALVAIYFAIPNEE